MDLATLVAISVCSGHCKGQIRATNILGMSSMAKCRTWLDEDNNKRVVFDDIDGSIIYHFCVQASPRIVRVSGFNIYPRAWWQR